MLPGTYFAFTDRDEGYLGQLWADQDCLADCDPLRGNPIEVIANSNLSRIDFDLDLGGVISGTVTEARSGAPVETHVAASDASGYEVSGSGTDANGRYEIAVLPPGDYYVRTYAGEELIDVVFDGVACRGECDLAAATALTVDVDEVLTGIDFALDRRGSVSGKVNDVRTGDPLSNVGVYLHDAEGELVGVGETDPAGRYTVTGLYPGVYFANTENNDGYRDQTYDAVPCSFECRPAEGTPIEVAAEGKVIGIDFALDRLGAISAAVTDAASGAALEGVDISIWAVDGDRVGSAQTDLNGLAAVGNLPPGTYFATTRNHVGYRDKLYAEIRCPVVRGGLCDPLKGTPIEVASDAITEIRFSLQRED